MKIRIQRRRRGEAGVALLYSVFAAFVAASMVSVMLTVSVVADKVSGVNRYGGQAKYLAEGAVEAAKKEIQESIANWTAVPASGSATINGIQVPYTIVQTGFAATDTDPSGIETLVTGYQITATATVQGNQATASRIVNSEATPIFQFAVFYNNDLEINPGPLMSVLGRVHSNGDMYLGSQNTTLTLNTNYVRAVGDIFRHRKDDPNASQGTVNIRRWVSNPFSGAEPSEYVTMRSQGQMNNDGITSTSGYDSNFTGGWDVNQNGDYTETGDALPWGPGALEYWSEPEGYANGGGHTVLSADHGMTEAVTPHIGSIQMYESVQGGDFVFDPGTRQYVATAPGTGTHNKGYYHSNAGLSIIVANNGTWKAFDGAGTNVTSHLTGVVSLSQMYDARQANGSTSKIWVANVDVAALNASGHFPSNGLLYAAHYGAGTGLNAKGIRLKNAAVLNSALTVVSENPLYVWGDYNVGDATHPQRGAALIGDAINLLSKSWDDAKVKGVLPSAANTTYNAALIGGNQESSVGQYNGGLENLPRFHENWSGKTCAFKGSFVNAYHSRFATGNWLYGSDRYEAPNRVWTYNTRFNNVANLPPFTPMAVSARDVVSW